MPNRFFTFCWLGFLLAFTSCSVTKYLPADEFLYDGSSIEVMATDSIDIATLKSELQTVLDNNTNTKTPILGYRQIYRYYKQQEKRRKNPKKEEKPDKGKAPIFFDDQILASTTSLLENRATNAGYFYHETSYQLDTNLDKRTVTVAYQIAVGTPHLIDSVAYYILDSSVWAVVRELRPQTLLKKGERYDLDLLKNERNRLKTALRNKGYYFIQDNDFVFLADTLQGNHEVDLLIKLKTDVPESHLKPQQLLQVNVFPNIQLGDTLPRLNADTIMHEGIRIVCQDCPLRPSIIDEAFATKAGELYSPENHDKSLRRLASYNMFRYVSFSYDRVPGSDSSLILNAYLQPQLRRRVEFEAGVSYNNARYFGPEIGFAYTNRNLLKGAELLRIEGDFSYAFFLGNRDQTRVPRSGVYGLSASLNIPRLWMPKRRKIIPRVMNSGTSILLGGRVEDLQMNLARFEPEIIAGEFAGLAEKIANDSTTTENVSLRQFRIEYGYNWQRKTTKKHQLFPLSIRYQDPSASSEDVLQLSRQLGLAQQSSNQGVSRFDRMLLFVPNYQLTLDTRLAKLKTHNTLWQQKIALGINNIFPLGNNGTGGSELSIYPQLETDLRHYWLFNNRQSIAARIHAGIAFPLTDRAIVPYFDLYTIGGPNSLRGFSPRQLGPGRTVPLENSLLTLGGFGNVLLETSIEYRHRINSMVEVALFADAGNIWTYKTELEPLDTDFNTSSFLDEIAANAGVGLRFDLQFIILRIDVAKPLLIPYEDQFNDPDTLPVGARLDDQIKFVLAFGYPF